VREVLGGWLSRRSGMMSLMGLTSLHASNGVPQGRLLTSTAAEDAKVRVVGATILQSIGVLLLMHVGEVGGPATDVRLGLVYGALHIAVGAAVLGFRPSLPAVSMFLLPGSLLALIAALGGGYWAGAWVFGLTAWAFLSSELTTSSRPHCLVPRLLRLVLGIILAAPLIGLSLFWQNPIAYLLAIIPWGLLLLDHYAHRPWRAATDCALGAGLLVLLITVPQFWLSPEGSVAGISAISGFGTTWLTRRRS
jgi:hypothetical protein